MRFVLIALASAALAGAAPACAHALHPEPAQPAIAWTFEPWVLICLALSLFLYAAGAVRLHRRARHGHHALRWQAAAFFAGWLALAAALVSPLDALGAYLFSAHMVQHELLMIVAAPLLVLGRPLVTWLWALPPGWRAGMIEGTRHPAARLPWDALTRPAVSWPVHAAALWLWHVPALFDAALKSDGIHVLQHLSFLASALLFWWAVLGDGWQRPSRAGAMIYLFTTMLHTGALGALLTWSAAPWYASYAGAGGWFGLDPLEDQQLGGLIMWIPGGLAYVLAALFLGAQWLARDGRPIEWQIRNADAD